MKTRLRCNSTLLLGMAPFLMLFTHVWADEPTVEERLAQSQRELEAARARSLYYQAQLRWKSDRLPDAINVLRQVPDGHRNLEWYLTHDEFSSGDINCYGHTDSINSVAFSPDGSLVASGGGDNRVRLWDARTGRQLKVWKGLGVEPNAAPPDASGVRFSPDGSKLAAACGYGSDIGFKGVIKIWDVKTGELLNKVNEARWLTRLQFSSDGKRIAYGALNNRVGNVWDWESGKKITFTMEGKSNSIPWAFSPDGSLMALGQRGSPRYVNNRPVPNDPCDVVLWDAYEGKKIRTFKGNKNCINILQFSPDGLLLVTGDRDRQIKIWNVKTGEELHTITGSNPARFSADGKHLVTNTPFKTSTDITLQFLNLETGEVVRLQETNTPAHGGAVHPDGTCIAGVAGGRIKLWDVRTGATIRTLKGHVNGFQRMDFSPDGAWLVTGGADQTVRLWDCRGPAEFPVLASDRIAFSPDGKHIATADTKIQVQDAHTAERLFELKQHTEQVNGLAYSSDSKFLASVSNDATARVWDAVHGKELAVLNGHASAVTGVAFSRDGTTLVTSGQDLSVRVWDWRTGKQSKQFSADPFSDTPRGRPKAGAEFIDGVTISPDGKWILALYKNGDTHPRWDHSPAYHIYMWDAATGKRVATLKGHRYNVTALAFSLDSRWIVSGGKDNSIRVWSVETRQEVRAMDGHLGPVHDVCFSPDSRRIVSTSADGTVRIWDASNGEELKKYGNAKKTRQSAWSIIRTRARVAITGGTVVAKRGNKLSHWSARPTERLRVLAGPKKPMTVSAEGKMVASTSGDTVLLWDTITGKTIRRFKVPVTPIRSLAFDKTGDRLLAAIPSRVNLWDTKTGQTLREFHSGIEWLVRAGFNPNGETIVAEGFWKRAAWDAKSGQAVPIAFKDWPHAALDSQLRSSDGRWVLIPSASHVHVADIGFNSEEETQSYFQSKTSRSAQWHKKHATIAEEKSNLYATAFHRAWQLKIGPKTKEARDELLRITRKLTAESNQEGLVPAIVKEVLADPR